MSECEKITAADDKATWERGTPGHTFKVFVFDKLALACSDLGRALVFATDLAKNDSDGVTIEIFDETKMAPLNVLSITCD